MNATLVRPSWMARMAAGLLALSAAVAGAAPVPDSGTTTTITARDQPIAAFLRDLFSQSDHPVVASPALTGTVNGVFVGSSARIFRDIARAFNLSGYYDGNAVYVYPSTDLGSKSFALGFEGSRSVLRSAAGLGLFDAQNYIRITRTGGAVASGTPRFLDQVSSLAATVITPDRGLPPRRNAGQGADARGGPAEFRVFYLRYARAEDTTVYAGGREVRIPGIATILRSLVLDPRNQPNMAIYGSRQVRQSAQRVGGTGLGAVDPDTTQSPILGLPSIVVNGVPLPANNGVPGSTADGGPIPNGPAETVRIEANPSLNAVIIRDTSGHMAAYDGLIRAIDVEPQLVEIEATIIDINTSRLRQLGVDFNLATGGFGALFGNGTASDLTLSPNNALNRADNTRAITPSISGLALSTVIGAQREFLSRISALESKGAARIVSRPQVMTLSNVEAVFDRTRTFYVRVAGRQNVDLFNVTTGTTLRVNPSVFRDQGQTRIKVLIGIEDGSLSSDQVDSIPIVDRASVTTQALILEGESLLLGGLTADTDTNNEDKIPLLGDIPIVGNIFKKQNKQRARTERLFLITPRLVSLTKRSTAQLPGQAATTASAAAAMRAPLPKP